MMLSTARKLAFARGVSRVLIAMRRALGRQTTEVRVYRRGAWWALDLREGVQLGIYLGTYERHTTRLLTSFVRGGDLVLDIGANVGTHTLPLARAVGPEGRVIAVEPSVETFERLRHNRDLNPELRARIHLVHAALGAPGGRLAPAYYGSWPLTDAPNRHAIHEGSLQSSNGASFDTVDALAAALSLDRVSLIKLDVDGDELPILDGAVGLIQRDKPIIVFEYCPYLLAEQATAPADLLTFFLVREYQLHDDCERPISDVHAFTARIPSGGGVNVIAAPTTSSRGAARLATNNTST